MIQQLTISHIAGTAYLHKDGLAYDFLPSFGEEFLSLLHKHILLSKQSISFGFFKRRRLQGFIIGSLNTKKLFRDVIRSGFRQLMPYILKKIIISPHISKYLIQTIFYGNGHSDKIDAEIIILAVGKRFRRTGVATKLMNALSKEFFNRKVKKYKVGTLSTNNAANSFYKKLGGQYAYSFRLYNRTWNVYHYIL